MQVDGVYGFGKGSVTDSTRALILVEGFPPDTDPGDAWTAALVRHRRERDRDMTLVSGIAMAIRLNFADGGRAEDLYRPFYTDREWEERNRRIADERAREAAMKQYEMLHRMMSRDARRPEARSQDNGRPVRP